MKLLTGRSRAAASRVSTLGTVFRLAIFISFAIILSFTISAAAQDHADAGPDQNRWGELRRDTAAMSSEA